MDRKIPLIYDTLSDCINDPNIVGGMVVKTLGENTIDDGNGRIYKVYDPSMGVVYNKDKHILLAKSGTFMGSVEDTPLYEGLREANDDIEYLKNQSSIADLSHMEKCFNNEAELKADDRLSVGMTVKTYGRLTPGDGYGMTYKIVSHEQSTPYADDEIALYDFDIAAKIINASYAEAISIENKDDVDAMKTDLHENILGVFDELDQFKQSTYPKNGMSVRLLGKEYIGDGIASLYKVYEESTARADSDVELARVYNSFNELNNALDVVDGMRARIRGSVLYKIYDAKLVNGYLFNNMFYVDDAHTVPIKIADNMIYTDITPGGGTKKYVWNSDIFEVLTNDIVLTGSGLHARIISKGLYAMPVKEVAEGGSIAELENRVDNLSDNLDNTNDTLGGVINILHNDILPAIPDIRDDIVNVQDSLRSTNMQLNQVSDDLSSTNTRITQVDTNLNSQLGSTNTRVTQLETNLGTTNNRLEQTRTSLTQTNSTINSLRSYTYSNINDLLYQINDPYISDWKKFIYYEIEKDPYSGAVTSKEFIIAIESGSNGVKHIITSSFAYPVYCYVYNDRLYKDSAHTQSITPIDGHIYIDKDTNQAYQYDASIEGFIEIEDPGLYVSGGDEPEPINEELLFKEVRSELSATVAIDGPWVIVDVEANTADWIGPLVLKHFLPDPEPDPETHVQGYYSPLYRKFFENYDGTTFSDEIIPEEGIIYINKVDNKNDTYIWDGESYVLYEEEEESSHFFDEEVEVMLNSDSTYPVTVTYKTVESEYIDDDGNPEIETVPHYIFKAKRAPENRVVYYV